MFTTQSPGYIVPLPYFDTNHRRKGVTIPPDSDTARDQSPTSWALVGTRSKHRTKKYPSRLTCDEDTSNLPVPNVLKGLVG